jgi:RNA polymerase subunit RPABC4/transcription elongation factor Spt4
MAEIHRAETQQPPIEKRRIDRSRREKFRFSTEIRIIPRGLVMAVVALYLIAVSIALAVNWNGSGPGGALFLAGVLTAVSIIIAAYIFLVAYINRDAKRRGMSPTLWTLLVIFLPGTPVSGSIIYFLVRKPLPFHCPQCGFLVRADFNFCPQCKRNLRPACPHCGHEIAESDRYCPNCAWELTGPVQA